MLLPIPRFSERGIPPPEGWSFPPQVAPQPPTKPQCLPLHHSKLDRAQTPSCPLPPNPASVVPAVLIIAAKANRHFQVLFTSDCASEALDIRARQSQVAIASAHHELTHSHGRTLSPLQAHAYTRPPPFQPRTYFSQSCVSKCLLHRLTWMTQDTTNVIPPKHTTVLPSKLTLLGL
jgi:hypothetical protein